ncbi:collagen alpha-1(I) chain-like [Vulpes lagopus]|uniref:collagen alpha-1(I) chain-like n=1 Tax=Vulpes lagopus TaxID=494514 RepID=UPI001BC9D465|nr:collagen alpha-1(I) chain-like [Vulpes lagopus]
MGKGRGGPGEAAAPPGAGAPGGLGLRAASPQPPGRELGQPGGPLRALPAAPGAASSGGAARGARSPTSRSLLRAPPLSLRSLRPAPRGRWRGQRRGSGAAQSVTGCSSPRPRGPSGLQGGRGGGGRGAMGREGSARGWGGGGGGRGGRGGRARPPALPGASLRLETRRPEPAVSREPQQLRGPRATEPRLFMADPPSGGALGLRGPGGGGRGEGPRGAGAANLAPRPRRGPGAPGAPPRRGLQGPSQERPARPRPRGSPGRRGRRVS